MRVGDIVRVKPASWGRVSAAHASETRTYGPEKVKFTFGGVEIEGSMSGEGISVEREVDPATLGPPLQRIEPFQKYMPGCEPGSLGAIRASVAQVAGVGYVVEVVTVEPGVVGVTVHAPYEWLAKAYDAACNAANAGTRIVLRQLGGHVQPWPHLVEAETSIIQAKEELKRREKARQLSVQTECDEDTLNFGDA